MKKPSKEEVYESIDILSKEMVRQYFKENKDKLSKEVESELEAATTKKGQKAQKETEENKESKENKYNITKLNHTGKEELTFSIIIDGAQNTGRTSIIQKFIDLDNSNHYNNSLGHITSFKFIKIENTIVKLEIIDYTINDISKRSISNYKNANLIMLVYSIDDYTSFEKIKNKLYTMKFKSTIFLIANKSDLEKREVNKDDVESILNNYNINYFNEVSAKTGSNIDDIFFEAVNVLYKNRKPTTQHNKQFGYKGNDNSKNNNNNALNFLFPI